MSLLGGPGEPGEFLRCSEPLGLGGAGAPSRARLEERNLAARACALAALLLGRAASLSRGLDSRVVVGDALQSLESPGVAWQLSNGTSTLVAVTRA